MKNQQRPPFRFGRTASLGSEIRLRLVDPWLASSLLQKSIRRGEVELAEEAAAALFRFRGSATWKRFLVITIEDIGIAHTATLIEVAAICHDRALRQALGGDEDAARYLARKLAAVPKDRSADLLASTVCYHPTLSAIRRQIQNITLPERLDWLTDASRSKQAAGPDTLRCDGNPSAQVVQDLAPSRAHPGATGGRSRALQAIRGDR